MQNSNDKGKLKRRRIRANQNNLSTDERIVLNMVKLEGITTKEAWRKLKLKVDMQAINAPSYE